jgi:hypothetical protein
MVQIEYLANLICLSLIDDELGVLHCVAEMAIEVEF